MGESSTVRVRLAYGEEGLDVDLPADRTTVVEPTYVAAPDDQAGLLRRALREPVDGPPLRELVRPGQTVAISMCDGTRPQPRHLMVPAVLDELDGIVAPEDVVVLVATGTHRGNTDAEIRAMLGDAADRVRVVNHDARDDSSLVWLGRHGDGVPVFLNRLWVEADVRVTTGFVEPHFFAGFSGGPKLVAPGLAGLETVLTLHDARRIGDPRATWAVCEGNPVHDDIRAVVAAVGRVDFGLDVVLNREQRIVEAFGGSLSAMHAAARAASQRLAMQPVPSLFDVVVTTNAGYPLDQNLYQAVKGMSAGATVVRPGGTIVCAAECRDGFPDHGSYREVLASEPSPGGAAGHDRGARAHGPRPVAGAGAGQGAGPRGRRRAVVVPLGRRPRLRPPRAHRGRRGDGAGRAARRRPGQPGLRAAGGSADDPVRRLSRRAQAILSITSQPPWNSWTS